MANSKRIVKKHNKIEKEIKNKTVKNIIKESQEDLILKMAAKLEVLENQLNEREEKLTAIEQSTQSKGRGLHKYGLSDWENWENGSEKGYHRSCYVDIRSMIGPQGAV